MQKIRIGINGLGRIGRNLCRLINRQFLDRFEIVAANDVVPTPAIAKSLQRDSVHGRFPGPVKAISDDQIQLDQTYIRIFKEQDAPNLPWGDLGVDLVFECSTWFKVGEKNINN